jgi:cyclophilin family peptidyl-prolyl cis-trans isomerase
MKMIALCLLATTSIFGFNFNPAHSLAKPETAILNEMNSEPEKKAVIDPAEVIARVPKDGDEVAVLETAQGRIVIMFFPDVAPGHVARIKECVSKDIYTGTFFHRVIPGFMIQGGDPNTKGGAKAGAGTGGYGTKLKQEFSAVPHERGICSMARSSDPNSAASQIFIMHKKSPHLDNQYTVWGKVVEGMEAVDKIVALPKDRMDMPTDVAQSTITSAKLAKWPLK